MDNKEVALTVEINDVITYAIQQNGLCVVREINLYNQTDQEFKNLILKIRSDGEFLIPFEQGIQTLRAGEELRLIDLKVLIKGDYLASLTERIACVLSVELFDGEGLLAIEHMEIVALAYDEWPGLKYFPDYIAAYVTPNHPVIAELLQSASKWLGKWTMEPSLEGYQCQNPNRIKKMAAAAYIAIQERNITYANPPTSFETLGQRVRLCDTVMEQRLGTCMDMSLLYASVLEAMGLNPLLVLVQGHIFAGVWLVDQSFFDPIVDDPSQLEKRMAEGIHELLVVECTAMCAGKTYDFESAVKMAMQKVKDYPNYQFSVDILRARRSGVRPLPARIKSDQGYIIKPDNRNENDVTTSPDDLGYTLDFNTITRTNETTKQMQWERKLLDLSMRNMLINMRLTKAIVPLLTADLCIIEDALADGEEFQVTPRPLEWELAQIDVFHTETTNQLGPYQELIALECRHKRIPSICSENDLNTSLTKIYRSAKSALEENGTNTLYLALGLLRWFEKNSDHRNPRYAPIALVPIEIIRKSASKGYMMRMRDEDAQINITLLEFLKQNFGIVIGGLSPAPMDEHGLDMKKIFAIIRHAIFEETMWNVIESSFIGNFSFSQFVMWNDIRNNSAMLERNKIVRSLKKGTLDWDCSTSINIQEEEAYLPVSADASQLRAITMAANNESFVLHGPPGTGKSQTITAMIANALTKGKTVLFVAEKMAALEVVQKRLATLGIGDFCLELHSNKATKKSVLDQLKRGLEIRIYGMETEYDNKIQDVQRMRGELDAYGKALHANRPFGKTVRELIDLYQLIPDGGEEVIFEQAFVAELTQTKLDTQKHILERLVAVGKGIGHPFHHALSAVQQTEYSQTLKVELHEVLSNYLSLLYDFKDRVTTFSNIVELKIPESKDEWDQVLINCEALVSSKNIPSFLMYVDNLDMEFIKPLSYMKKSEDLMNRKTVLLSQWNEIFLRMDMAGYRKRYDEAGKKIIGKGKAYKALREEIQAFASTCIPLEMIPVHLSDVSLYQKEKESLEVEFQNLPMEWRTILHKYTMASLLEYKDDIKERYNSIRKYLKQIQVLDEKGNLQSILNIAGDVIIRWDKLVKQEERACNLLQLELDDISMSWLQDRINICKSIMDHDASLKDWIVYRQFSKEAKEVGLTPIVEAYEAGLSHDKVVDVYLKSIYKSIVLHVIDKEPALNNFTGIGFNERISQFKKLDQEFMQITKDEMYHKLTNNLPSSYEFGDISTELNKLKRAISSNGRGLSIRSLFEQIPNVLKKLCPCMLMSPISVAQYLSTAMDPFDIVIFDEASQIPTCKAIGVLARGDNAVIVGDPNQMPPTSFFAGNSIDEDNIDIEDLDSILDDCLALGMPQTYLQWHYRSKHESLIAFSNHEFYENGMLTFPSHNDREKRIHLQNVHGFFDRGKTRTNQAEAEAIVKEIKLRYRDELRKTQSIGVVTFNSNQQNLIEDILAKEYQKDVDFDVWANASGESLLVKNLENVQGDERDVIFFSLAFGPDAEGKFFMNFGPLNKDGGWRRLNVAVSRAKNEMIVYSIMTADMIDLRRTKSKGVEALRDFLEYADKGKLQNEYFNLQNDKNQGILQKLCYEISNAGFEYRTSVGHSKFKVDLAVINPYAKDEYLLGIMLDGDSYRQSTTTKDREISQIEVLQLLGWNIKRLWTMDWWDNSDKELGKMLAYLNEKLEEAKTIANENKTAMETQIYEDESDEFAYIKQEARDENFIDIPQEAEEMEFIAEVPQNVEFTPKYHENTYEVGTNAPSLHSKSRNTEIVHASMFRYEIVDYISANVEVTPLPTNEYVKKTTMAQILQKANSIIEIEAPISYERIVKKLLKSFSITRASTQALEATEKALKKVSGKSIRQNGTRFYWRNEQDPDSYTIYRKDVSDKESRNLADISQQELKNAICKTLTEKGPMSKDPLLRESIHTMGYKRSTTSLLEAIQRGLKYGKKTGEILLNEAKLYYLKDM